MTPSRLESRASLLRALVFVSASLAAGALLAQGGTAGGPAALTLPDLIAPLAPGSVIAEGYVLSAPHRGEEHDITFQARRTRDGVTTVVELHILDRGRWTGIRETEHYGVAWELPRSTAPRSDSEAVAERLAQAVRSNEVDPGLPVDALALRRDAPAPPVVSMLQRATGARGVGLAVLLVLATWALATLPRGAALVSVFLCGLGLALRLPHLDVPFVRDQDVQRVFTGHASIAQIFTGVGLADRHPPLYFLVLHAVQRFGQAEVVVRLPAVLSGALMGPTLVGAAVALRQRVELGALLALVPTVAFAFVASSREVSPLPLYALLLVFFAVAILKHHETGARRWQVAVVLSAAGALFTSYTAALPVLAVLALLGVSGAAYRPTLRALSLGCLVGSPALVLAGVTYFRDRPARAAADARPTIAWGDHEPLEMARALSGAVDEALGPAVLVLVVAAAVVAVRRRTMAAGVPLVMFAATFVGIALLTPVARVQPYYLMGVVPLLLLAAAGATRALGGRPLAAVTLAVAVSVVLSLAPRIAPVATLYVADERATMPAFVDVMLDRPERRVVTTAHYDLWLLSYYLGRALGVEMDWGSLPQSTAERPLRGTDFRLAPLVHSHVADAALEEHALASLEELIAAGPCLVVDRPTLGLDGVQGRLARCERLAEGPDSALYRCAPDDPPAR